MSEPTAAQPEVVPALTDEQRAEIEAGLSQGLLCSVYVDNAAKITIDVKLPNGVTDDDTEALSRDIEQAVEELAKKIDRVLPKGDPA